MKDYQYILLLVMLLSMQVSLGLIAYQLGMLISK